MPTDKEKKWKIETSISLLSLIISIGALIFTIYYNLAPGTVQPFKPSAFVIIRGVGWFASDHLVIPIEWENNGGRSVIIRHPMLALHELDNGGNETGKILNYYLAGEYPEMSSKAFQEQYSAINSFIIDPHSVTLKTLVFHVENWWDDKGSTYSFHFVGGSNFKLYIEYEINLEPETTIYLCNLNVYGSTDNLNQDRSKGYWWEFWPIK